VWERTNPYVKKTFPSEYTPSTKHPMPLRSAVVLGEKASARTGGVAQAAECWLCKHEALSSNSSLTKKKKKKKKMHLLQTLTCSENFISNNEQKFLLYWPANTTF
jgi:hypothetical protein